MYCKKCHKSINQNTIGCPYCGYNNSNDYDIGDTIEIDIAKINGSKKPPKKHKSDPVIVTLVAMIVIGSILVTRYLMYDSKSNDNSYYTTTTTKEVVNTKEFKLDNIRLYYTLEFDKDKNTIYLIDNKEINIKIDTIDNDEYYEIINNNEVLDVTLNTIEAKTYANDNVYGYLLENNKKKYHITVNYTDNISEEIQSSLDKIIKSIKIKE